MLEAGALKKGLWLLGNWQGRETVKERMARTNRLSMSRIQKKKLSSILLEGEAWNFSA